MVAADPDINDTAALNFKFSEPITAEDKIGNEILDSDVYKVPKKKEKQ